MTVPAGVPAAATVAPAWGRPTLVTVPDTVLRACATSDASRVTVWSVVTVTVAVTSS